MQAQRQQRRTGERGAGRELRVHGRSVGDERGREPDRDRRAERPRVGHDAQREQVGEGHRQRCDRREEELDGPGATERVCGGDQQREPDSVGLVQPSLRLAAVNVELVGVEAREVARGVLVLHVDVPVLDDRLRRQEVVRLVAAVVRLAEGIEPQRGRVGRQQEHPEGGGSPHPPPQQPRWRAITICCTSSVPSPIVRILASR